jgi:hypothetical protein
MIFTKDTVKTSENTENRLVRASFGVCAGTFSSKGSK